MEFLTAMSTARRGYDCSCLHFRISFGLWRCDHLTAPGSRECMRQLRNGIRVFSLPASRLQNPDQDRNLKGNSIGPDGRVLA